MSSGAEPIHKALAQPIRKHIVEYLSQGKDATFSELLKYVAFRNHGKLGFHIRALMELGLVEREPLTRKYRLTDKGQLTAELMLDTLFLIERGVEDLEHEPTRYARRLRLGEHAVLFYDTEDIKHEITFP